MDSNPEFIFEQHSTAASDPEEIRTDPLLVPQHERINYLQISTSPRIKDERRHKRISGRETKACIRVGECEEIVQVLNLSRTGICFAAWKHYLPDTRVMVASPFTLAGNNIFLPAHIVRAQRRATPTIPGEYALMIDQ
jgi:PilZ domain